MPKWRSQALDDLTKQDLVRAWQRSRMAKAERRRIEEEKAVAINRAATAPKQAIKDCKDAFDYLNALGEIQCQNGTENP